MTSSAWWHAAAHQHLSALAWCRLKVWRVWRNTKNEASWFKYENMASQFNSWIHSTIMLADARVVIRHKSRTASFPHGQLFLYSSVHDYWSHYKTIESEDERRESNEWSRKSTIVSFVCSLEPSSSIQLINKSASHTASRFKFQTLLHRVKGLTRS